jgi:hypothetical protein
MPANGRESHARQRDSQPGAVIALDCEFDSQIVLSVLGFRWERFDTFFCSLAGFWASVLRSVYFPDMSKGLLRPHFFLMLGLESFSRICIA